MTPLARDHLTLFRSDDPQNTCAYSPGLARCADGRIVATMDTGSLRQNEKPNPDGSPNIIWRTKIGSILEETIPAISGNMAYLLCTDGYLYAFQ